MFCFRVSNAVKYLLCFLCIAFITRIVGKETEKPWFGFEYIREYDRHRDSAFTARHDQDAIDLYKQYKHSIYVSRWYNASFVCQIPFFTLTLPQRNRVGSVNTPNMGYNVGYPLIQALFVLAGIALFSPLIFPEHRRRSLAPNLNVESINRFLENQMNFMSESAISRSLRSEERHSMFYFLGQNLNVAFESVLNSMDNSLHRLPYFARNKLQNCFQWSVCELYNKPKKYGLIGLLFRAVFPYNDDLDNKSSNVMSRYRLAAVYGKQRGHDCGHQYNGCTISVWEVVREVIVYIVNQTEHKLSRTQKMAIFYVLENIVGYLMK